MSGSEEICKVSGTETQAAGDARGGIGALGLRMLLVGYCGLYLEKPPDTVMLLDRSSVAASCGEARACKVLLLPIQLQRSEDDKDQ